MEDKIKQVIVVRKDLNMRKGKMCAQAAHAAMAFITRRMQGSIDSSNDGDGFATAFTVSEVERSWIENSFTKIVLSVDSELELIHLSVLAENAGVICHTITDNGDTEFHGEKTLTCLALGPDYSSKIDPLTKDLKLI